VGGCGRGARDRHAPSRNHAADVSGPWPTGQIVESWQTSTFGILLRQGGSTADDLSPPGGAHLSVQAPRGIPYTLRGPENCVPPPAVAAFKGRGVQTSLGAAIQCRPMEAGFEKKLGFESVCLRCLQASTVDSIPAVYYRDTKTGRRKEGLTSPGRSKGGRHLPYSSRQPEGRCRRHRYPVGTVRLGIERRPPPVAKM